MNEECLICKAPLIYLDTEELMQCELCHEKRFSKTRCVNGHFVCDECHQSGMDEIISICFNTKSKNPIEIMEKMMSIPSCHMHGPEHHVMVGSALITAYKNVGGDIDLKTSLCEMQKRGKQVPGGACGFWGACGAGVSAGMYVSIVLKSTPLKKEAWGLSNQMTARALSAIGNNGGPRCCKRDSYLAIIEAIKFTSEKLSINMDTSPIICSRSQMNNQCLHKDCPFYKKEKKNVAFICTHNSCRSQIAEALGRLLLNDSFNFYSAGTELKKQINQDAVRIIKELYGVDLTKTGHPKLITDIPKPDVLISMGCGVKCPYAGKPFDEDWGLEDPTGKPDEDFIVVIKKIEKLVKALKEKYE